MKILKEDAELTHSLYRFTHECAIRLQQTYKFKQQSRSGDITVDMAEINTNSNFIHEVVKYNKIIYAEYNNAKFYALALSNGDIAINSSKINIDDSNTIRSALMHELRHLIDDFLSDSKAQKNYPNLDIYADKEIPPEVYSQYLKHNLEVSSRIEQALMYITNNFGYFLADNGIDYNSLQEIIRVAASNNNLTSDLVGDKIYQKLARRATQSARYLYAEYIKFLNKRKQK